MLTQVGLFVAGLAALVFGADLLVRGASRIAFAFGISPLVVGLTVVAFGTSAPEIAVSVGAVLAGTSDIAIGNVVGSNIFNIALILGVSALIVPLVVHSQVIRQEVPILIAASALLVGLAWDGSIGRVDALVFTGLLVAYTAFVVVQSRRRTRALERELGAEATPPARGGVPLQLALVGVGLGLLVLGSDWLVGAAVVFARAFGVSDLVVGLTIVAAGTSLPEVATSVMAAVKGERDIAVGNVVGSNLFNIFGCLGLSGLVAADGLAVAPAVMQLDIWVMLALAVALLPIAVTGSEISRREGAMLLVAYVAYAAWLVATAQSPSLQAWSPLVLGVAAVAATLALGVTVTRWLRAGSPREA